MGNGMTRKQESFVIEYIKDNNATQAAIRSGYSKRSAEVTGHRLLRNAKICEEIQNEKSKLTAELREKFIGDAIMAREIMLKVLNDPESSNRDKISVAMDLLDRAGYKPTERKELSGTNRAAIEIAFVDPVRE